ncbi:MAG: S9 family peptidase [Synechococcales cyanobacterium]
MTPYNAGYGQWPSPITAARVASSSLRLGQLVLDDQGTLYWTETRPQEQGRTVLMRRDEHGLNQVLPASFQVRTTVHEYGGGAFTVAAGQIVFSHFPDQRLYHWDGIEAQPLTELGCRYADGRLWRHWWIGVREDHRGTTVENALVAVKLAATDGNPDVVLHGGHDFYSSPRISPDGRRIAWITWDHPHMPWDNTQLWVAELDDQGSLISPQVIAGRQGEAIQQPLWSEDGWLFFISDRSGWWNGYRWRDPEGILPIWPWEAEFGVPPWIFGQSTHALIDPDHWLATYSREGVSHLVRVHVPSQTVVEIPTPYTHMESLQVHGGQVYFLGGAADRPLTIVALSLTTDRIEELRRSSDLTLEPGYCSQPQAIAFPSAQGRAAYGFYYPPTHPQARGIPGECPPLLVKSHGGPTGSTSTVLNWGIQFWTSRGFAVLDVNYGGSTGYGRAYREILRGQWGLVDAEDVVAGAQWLVQQGLADPDRLAIAGGSAGGYTTLVALTFHQVFQAGASYYGIGDLLALATDTHKFESRYLDGLVGAPPDDIACYQARSPIYHVDRLSCPVIFFQGLEDKVVPPNQAEKMVAALQDKGIPVRYFAFPGEQHGFRQASTIQTCLEEELAFYQDVFGIAPSAQT